MSYGKVYKVTWWGKATDNNKGWGIIYLALVIDKFTQLTNLTWSRLTNILWQT